MSLVEHNAWLISQSFKPGTISEICQCGTEKIIKRSPEPEYMRAVLLSYVFLDQFMFSHFGKVHEEFKKRFPGPTLCNHPFGGCASPGWLIYSRHGFDEHANWDLIKQVFYEHMEGGLSLSREQGKVNERDYWDAVETEIKSEFEVKHQQNLLSVIPDFF